MFVPGKPFQPSPMFVRPGGLKWKTRVEDLKGSSLVQAPALPTNIKLGWKGLPWTNTVAYYENS